MCVVPDCSFTAAPAACSEKQVLWACTVILRGQAWMESRLFSIVFYSPADHDDDHVLKEERRRRHTYICEDDEDGMAGADDEGEIENVPTSAV